MLLRTWQIRMKLVGVLPDTAIAMKISLVCPHSTLTADQSGDEDRRLACNTHARPMIGHPATRFPELRINGDAAVAPF